MDEQLIFKLIDKFNSGDMSELEYSQEKERLLIRKNINNTHEAVPSSVPQPATRLGLPVQPTMKEEGEVITSPIVATFYASTGPDKEPFVARGARVKAGDTLCILEAMKMMNRLEAEFDCEIVKIEAKSGDLVEYGQVLFRVKRL